MRRLLALLVLRANTVTSVGQIGWHVGLTDGAVRTGMVRLRRRLGAGSGLLTESPGYVLRSDRIDHVRFEAAVSAASGAVGALADPADLDTILQLRRTRVDGVLLAGQLDAAADALRAVWAESRRRSSSALRRPLAAIDLLWVQAIVGDDDEVRHARRRPSATFPAAPSPVTAATPSSTPRRLPARPSAERLLTVAQAGGRRRWSR